MRLRALLAAALAWFAAASTATSAKPVQPPVGEFVLPARPIWTGEIFDLGFAWTVDWQSFSYLEGPLEWETGGLVTQPWQGPSQRPLPGTGAGRRATISYRTTALAVRPGRLVLSPPRQLMVLRTGVVRMSDYERATIETHHAIGRAANLEVRALPPAPQGFTGGLGRFALSAEIAPRQVRVGERFTWTLQLAGIGNWPALKQLPRRVVSNAFEPAGPPRLIETAVLSLFERSVREEVDLIARMPGRHVLGPVSMTIFDPERGRYTELRTAAFAIEVLGSGQPSAGAGAGGAAGQVKELGGERLPPLLEGSGTTEAPLSGSEMRLAFASPPAGLLLAWLVMAFLRARKADPEREARKSHRRIRKTLKRLSCAGSEAERRRLVREWQRAVGARWKLNHAAPVPASFSGDPNWRRLWEEADLFLYGRGGKLSPDWSERAFKVWEEQGRPPSFAPRTMFLRRNLFPLCLLVAAAPVWATAGATAPVSTATALRQELPPRQLDWRARYNLAVSLASAERWDEAAAHAAVAWVQQPTSRDTRALWLRLAGEAGYPLEGEGTVPRPAGWLGMIASAAPPRLWQQILIGSWSLLAFGALLVLVLLFGRRRRWLLVASVSSLAVGLGGMAVTWMALSSYGALASREAAIIWETGPLRDLPVESSVEAGAAVAGAGLIGRVDRAFLDWRRIDFGDGRSGWVRERSLVRVWES